MEPNIWNVCPDELSSSTDPSFQLAQLALAGYSQLAVDTILRKENQGKVLSLIEKSINQLDQAFQENRESSRKRSTEALFELSLNFLGMEGKRAGFTDEESFEVIDRISRALQKWERFDGGESSRAVIGDMLKGMKMVLSGKGMVARLAQEIEASLAGDDISRSFIESSKKAIETNVYYQIVNDGLSKFGNDSATGLRWARHLGAVQVSSNPVIAARAYEEISDLWHRFGVVASAHPEWSRDPEKFADEIALYGTVVSLLPNILDFRPIALLSDFKDGMVSIQLNPQKATSIEESMKDALKFYSILQEILENYDAYLVPGVRAKGKTRPNIVFKVSTCGEQAIGLTEGLDKIGIGTNNTVTFSVSQEIKMTIVALKGLATALKAGIPITTIYMTNMEGRLEDHLRESEAARLLAASLRGISDQENRITILAQKAGVIDLSKLGFSLEQRIDVLCSKKYLKSLNDDWFVEAIGKDKISDLKETEQAIRMSGIYVTRKVFQILFSPIMTARLVEYVEREFGLSKARAAEVVEAVNLLPASKRRAEDTYLVLGDRRISNLTNTEFPDHQLKVVNRSRESGFDLLDFEDSIVAEPDGAVVGRLFGIPDFRKAYELNLSLVSELSKAGIDVQSETGGMEPYDWSSFGPTKKTMDEFIGAYVSFRDKLMRSIANTTAQMTQEREITAHPKAK